MRSSRARLRPVRTLDLWSLMHASVADTVQQAYLRLVQEYPDLYERIYQLDERTWRRIFHGDEAPPPQLAEGLERITAIFADAPGRCRNSARTHSTVRCCPCCALAPGRYARAAVERLAVRMPLLKWIWARLARRLERRVLAFRPDVVIATQMVPAALLSSVKVRRRVAVPSIAVPTDFGVHDFWIQPGTDVYCVAHDAIPGVPRPSVASVLITGVPLMPGFVRPPTCARQARARTRPGPAHRADAGRWPRARCRRGCGAVAAQATGRAPRAGHRSQPTGAHRAQGPRCGAGGRLQAFGWTRGWRTSSARRTSSSASPAA